MSIQSEINRIKQSAYDQATLIDQISSALEGKAGVNMQPIVDALAEKGQDTPADADVYMLAEAIASIESGGVKYTTGMFTLANDSTDLTISHGLGEIPDLFILVSDFSYSKVKSRTLVTIAYKKYTAATSPSFVQNTAFCSSTSAVTVGQSTHDIESGSKYASNLFATLYGATETEIKFGNGHISSYTLFLKSATPTLWIAAKTNNVYPYKPEEI